MPKKSRKDLEALFRAHGATTWPEVVSLVKRWGWRVVPRKGPMEALVGPGGTCIVHRPGEGVKSELATLRLRAIAADGDPPDVSELPVTKKARSSERAGKSSAAQPAPERGERNGT